LAVSSQDVTTFFSYVQECRQRRNRFVMPEEEVIERVSFRYDPKRASTSNRFVEAVTMTRCA